MDQSTRVSAITPTRNRPSFLRHILEVYDNQDWPNKELLVLDDSDNVNTTFLEIAKKRDDVHYWHTSERLSIGAKRNILIERSKGSLIAHFDDDDYYAPAYLSTMVNLISADESDLAKLAGWFCFHEASGKLGYWDTIDKKSSHTIFSGTESVQPKKESFTSKAYQSFLTGYGFSYVYKKSCWKDIHFPNQDHGEDSAFLENLRRAGKRIKLVADSTGICLHIIHQGNSSKCFPNYILPNFCLNNYFKEFKPSRAFSTSSSPAKPVELPSVTICTLTHNRPNFLKLLQTCIENQDYPLEKIEWLIVDDSTHESPLLTSKTKAGLTIKHQRLLQKVTLGAKRNLSHALCSGEIIVYMDDDDYYQPTRVSHAVKTLLASHCDIAGSTLLPIYFTQDQQLWMAGPYGKNHATANTFAMKKEFAMTHFYDSNANFAEEKKFLNNYTIPLVQLDPARTIICISHESNTFDKRKLRNHANPNMKRIDHAISGELRKLLRNYVALGRNSRTNSNGTHFDQPLLTESPHFQIPSDG